MEREALDDKIEALFIRGSLLMAGGYVLSWACPFSKKIWSPTFSLMTCGMCAVALALLMVLIDKRGYRSKWMEFFRIFGSNAIAMYALSDILLLPFSAFTWGNGQSIRTSLYGFFLPMVGGEMASLIYAIIFTMVCWLVAWLLYRRKIFIHL